MRRFDELTETVYCFILGSPEGATAEEIAKLGLSITKVRGAIRLLRKHDKILWNGQYRKNDRDQELEVFAKSQPGWDQDPTYEQLEAKCDLLGRRLQLALGRLQELCAAAPK